MTTQELKQYIDKVLGNSIRCLLPSYWWKRLFNQVADRIDEVEQSTTKLIDSKIEESKMPIVESVDELEKLELAKGGVAAVEKVGEPVVVNLEDCYLSADAATDWDKYTVIRGFSEKGAPSNAVGQIHLYSDKSMENGLTIACGEGKYFYYKIANGGTYYSSLEEVNEYLASGKYRLVFGYYIENVSAYVTLYSAFPQPSLYIKGDSWERLAKESDLVGNEGDNVVIIYANEESTRNTNAFNTIIDCYENEKPYVAVVKIDEMLYSANITIQKVNDRYGIMAQCINTAYNKVYGVLLGLSVETGVGLANLLTESELITIDSELSDTSTNAVENKVVTETLNTKVDKVEGKQLSTEDFTTALKTKLEGLNAFDPTEINNKVDGLQTQLNTLVSGDASTAIESFNEITAFLNGVTDSETLDGIIAGIEQQIAAKQEQLVSGTNIKTINGESVLGEGNIEIKADIDTTTLATKEELATLQNEVIANEEVTAAALNDLNDRISELAENVQGETVTKEEFETAVNNLNESLSGKADAQTTSEALTALSGQVETLSGQVETAVTSEQLSSAVDNVNNTILENEEVTAAALNDLKSQIKEIITRLNNGGL